MVDSKRTHASNLSAAPIEPISAPQNSGRCRPLHFAPAAIVLSALLSGCATVTSSTAELGQPSRGMTYFLPKRDVKIVADRKLLKKDELEKALAGKKAEIETLGTSFRTAKAAADLATARLGTEAVTREPGAAEIVRRELALANADLSLATFKRTKAEAEMKTVEEGLAALAAAADQTCSFQYSATMELMAPKADRSLLLVAAPYHNPLRDDEVKLAVNGEGLLTQANVVATDRTGDIVLEVASAIAGFGTGGGVSITESSTVPKLQNCALLPTKFTKLFDPANPASVAEANRDLVSSGFPFQVSVPLGAVPIDSPAPELASVSNTDSPANPGRSRTNLGAPVPTGYTLASLNKKGRLSGLFYRTPFPVLMELRQCKQSLPCSDDVSASMPIDAAVVMVPQAGPVSYVPLRSSAFVKTMDDVTFENGMIKSWNASRPSEVLEVVRLPVRILKAIVSVPAEIFKLRVDLSDQQKGLAASQQAQIAAQAELSALRACVDTAGADRDAALACFD